jgi:hypothetical protein
MSKKKNKNLFGFFEQQQSDVTDKINTNIDSDKRNKEADQEIGQEGGNNELSTLNMNKETEQYDGTNNVFTETEQETSNDNTQYEYKQETDKGNRETEQEAGRGKGFMEQFQKKVSRPTVEQTHRRQTYLIDKELISRLERLAKEQPKGFKTAVVNEGIRRVLDEIEAQRRK